MFELRVSKRLRAPVHPANPTYLVERPGFRLDFHIALRRKHHTPALAGGAVFLMIASWTVLVADQVQIISLCAAVIVASVAVYLARFAPPTLATATVHLVEVGQPLPIIDPVYRRRPTQPLEQYSDHPRGSFAPIGPYSFDFAVRLTEPNVATRLRRYLDDAGRRPYLSYAAERYRLDEFLRQNAPVPNKSVVAGRALGKSNDLRADVWPLLRVVLTRVLYPREPDTPHARSIESKPLRGEKGANFAHFALCAYLIPLSNWLLLVGCALLYGSLKSILSDGAVAYRVAIMAATIVWAISTYTFNDALVRDWKQWLHDCSERPLGHIPILLHRPENHPKYQWEELDELDFSDHIDDYIVDTATLFQVTVGTLAFFILAILEVNGA